MPRAGRVKTGNFFLLRFAVHASELLVEVGDASFHALKCAVHVLEEGGAVEFVLT